MAPKSIIKSVYNKEYIIGLSIIASFYYRGYLGRALPREDNLEHMLPPKSQGGPRTGPIAKIFEVKKFKL